MPPVRAHDGVAAVFDELAREYGVTELAAVLKSANVRSLALLRKLGFAGAAPAVAIRFDSDRDERVLLRPAVVA